MISFQVHQEGSAAVVVSLVAVVCHYTAVLEGSGRLIEELLVIQFITSLPAIFISRMALYWIIPRSTQLSLVPKLYRMMVAYGSFQSNVSANFVKSLDALAASRAAIFPSVRTYESTRVFCNKSKLVYMLAVSNIQILICTFYAGTYRHALTIYPLQIYTQWLK